MTYSPMRELMEDLVHRAGNFLLDHFGKDPQLLNLRNTAKEVVTTYDKMADELIIQGIRARYPKHGLLTEESGLLKGNPDWIWIVDSLDGTGNFANLNPFFSVCIALMHKRELVLGAIYAPAIGEFYLAEKGKGAYLNQRKIQVSEISYLHQSYVFYCEGGEKDRLRTADIMSRIYTEVMDLRKLGAAGLETAWIAAGKGEAYYTTKIDPWDVAPGVLLLQEAGGEVTDFKGNKWLPEQADLLFSNRLIHQDILKIISYHSETSQKTQDMP